MIDNNDEKNNEFIDFFPEMEYFLNAHLSSLLNGYVPPMQTSSDHNFDSIEVLDDEFFDDIDKKAKF